MFTLIRKNDTYMSYGSLSCSLANYYHCGRNKNKTTNDLAHKYIYRKQNAEKNHRKNHKKISHIIRRKDTQRKMNFKTEGTSKKKCKKKLKAQTKC